MNSEVETTYHDIRFGLRQLGRNIWFSCVCVVSLGLGIGAAVSVFSVTYAVLLNAFPYRNPSGIMQVQIFDHSGFRNVLQLTAEEFSVYKTDRAVEDAFVIDNWNMVRTDGGLPESVLVGAVSSNAFRFLGVPALQGRTILASDAKEGGEPQHVAVLSYRYWINHLGASPAAIGRVVQLNHELYQVIGVMPPRFNWAGSDLYVPLRLSLDPSKTFLVETRLNPHIGRNEAEAEIHNVLRQFAAVSPDHYPINLKVHLSSLTSSLQEQLSGTLIALAIAVALLLTVGCVNVSILLLVRGTSRAHEFALRIAVGAKAGRILRQLLTEALILAAIGGLLGILLAFAGIHLVLASMPPGTFPPETVINLNLPVLIFTVALIVVVAVVSGLAPAIQLSQPSISHLMQARGGQQLGTHGIPRRHSVLITAQVALTALILMGAASAVRQFLGAYTAELNYDPHNLLILGVELPENNTYQQWKTRINYFDQLRSAVSEVPGIRSVSIAAYPLPPVAITGWKRQIEVLGSNNEHSDAVGLQEISPEFF